MSYQKLWNAKQTFKIETKYFPFKAHCVNCIKSNATDSNYFTIF